MTNERRASAIWVQKYISNGEVVWKSCFWNRFLVVWTGVILVARQCHVVSTGSPVRIGNCVGFGGRVFGDIGSDLDKMALEEFFWEWLVCKARRLVLWIWVHWQWRRCWPWFFL
jgi:hypothetical protein